MRIGRHQVRRMLTAKRAYRAALGLAATIERARAIAALDSKVWRGQRVYRVRCAAGFGRGPHDQYLPAACLWTLMSVDRYRCPFHA